MTRFQPFTQPTRLEDMDLQHGDRVICVDSEGSSLFTEGATYTIRIFEGKVIMSTPGEKPVRAPSDSYAYFISDPNHRRGVGDLHAKRSHAGGPNKKLRTL